MNYTNFEAIITPARMGRYLTASSENTRKAMTLYRKNIKLSQELFTVISCFEIALRNAIDGHYAIQTSKYIRHSIQPQFYSKIKFQLDRMKKSHEILAKGEKRWCRYSINKQT